MEGIGTVFSVLFIFYRLRNTSQRDNEDFLMACICITAGAIGSLLMSQSPSLLLFAIGMGLVNIGTLFLEFVNSLLASVGAESQKLTRYAWKEAIEACVRALTGVSLHRLYKLELQGSHHGIVYLCVFGVCVFSFLSLLCFIICREERRIFSREDTSDVQPADSEGQDLDEEHDSSVEHRLLGQQSPNEEHDSNGEHGLLGQQSPDEEHDLGGEHDLLGQQGPDEEHDSDGEHGLLGQQGPDEEHDSDGEHGLPGQQSPDEEHNSGGEHRSFGQQNPDE
jgi:hypothetical protein